VYKIALVCENGASTGLCVQKMKAAAQEIGVEAEIAAHSFTQMDNLVKDMDVLLIGPQLSYRVDAFKQTYSSYAHKIALINPMDFGMMEGEKILRAAMLVADNNRHA
jgi:Phosphotransferase system cellobiose-specific component IIB